VVLLPTFGLRTHIWNTGLRSLALLAGFPLLLLLLAWGVTLLIASGTAEDVETGLAASFAMLPLAAPIAFAAAAIWFGIAWLTNQWIIDSLSGARLVTRDGERALWEMTENLAISRGMRMPRLAIIETPARNAFASGLTRDRGAITVTRGLMQALTPAELRAVLAHELTHIRNGDARLAVVAAIFAGIISLVGEVMWRGVARGGLRPVGRAAHERKGGGALVLFALAVGALAAALSVALRFALSRNREYLADAGAVELTQDPDAMVSALRRISGHSEMPDMPAELRAMLLHDGAASLGPRWFATHPALEDRVAALVRKAGARDVTPIASPTIANPWRATSLPPGN
jgi:heat shock protein HtpX